MLWWTLEEAQRKLHALVTWRNTVRSATALSRLQLAASAKALRHLRIIPILPQSSRPPAVHHRGRNRANLRHQLRRRATLDRRDIALHMLHARHPHQRGCGIRLVQAEAQRYVEHLQ